MPLRVAPAGSNVVGSAESPALKTTMGWLPHLQPSFHRFASTGLLLAILLAAMPLTAGAEEAKDAATAEQPTAAKEPGTPPPNADAAAASPEPATNPTPVAAQSEAAPDTTAKEDTAPEQDPAATGSTAAPDFVSQAKVQLPFGFKWGQNQEDVRVLLKGIGVRITERRMVAPDREAWTLEGFIKPLLVGTTIYFSRGLMEEVEMQFGSPDWQAPDYSRLRRKLLEQFNQVYGPNRVLTNERSTSDNVVQTLVGYQWQTQDTLLRVFDFGASDGKEHFRTVSVHYKYRDRVQMARRGNSAAKPNAATGSAPK